MSSLPLDCLGEVVLHLKSSKAFLPLLSVSKSVKKYLVEDNVSCSENVEFQLKKFPEKEVPWCMNLKILNKKFQPAGDKVNFDFFPNLKTLEARNCDFSKNRSKTGGLFQKNSLVSLETECCLGLTNEDFKNLKTLECLKLEIGVGGTIVTTLTDDIFKFLPNLRELDLGGTKTFKSAGFSHLRKLKELTIYSASGLDNKVLEHVGGTLEYLELFQCSSFRPGTFHHLVSLEMLIIRKCSGLYSRQNIEAELKKRDGKVPKYTFEHHYVPMPPGFGGGRFSGPTGPVPVTAPKRPPTFDPNYNANAVPKKSQYMPNISSLPVKSSLTSNAIRLPPTSNATRLPPTNLISSSPFSLSSSKKPTGSTKLE